MAFYRKSAKNNEGKEKKRERKKEKKTCAKKIKKEKKRRRKGEQKDNRTTQFELGSTFSSRCIVSLGCALTRPYFCLSKRHRAYGTMYKLLIHQGPALPGYCLKLPCSQQSHI